MLRDQMIREGPSPGEGTRRFYSLAKQGLLLSDDPTLLDFQVPYRRPRDEVAHWN